MGKLVTGALGGLFGGGGKAKAAAAQAQQQQQIAQINQQNAANANDRTSSEALGQAARRKRGNLLLDSALGKATLG